MDDQAFLEKVVDTLKTADEVFPTMKFEIISNSGAHLYQSTEFLKDDSFRDRVLYLNIKNDDPKYFRKQVIISQHNRAIKSQEIIPTINVDKIDGTIRPYVTLKRPIINPQTNNALATITSFHDLVVGSIHHLLFRSTKQNTYPINTDYDEFKLTHREKQLIFLFLGGLASIDIAKLISGVEGKQLSGKTIDNIFTNQLFKKFDVLNREALREKLFELGFDQVLPLSLIEGLNMPISPLSFY